MKIAPPGILSQSDAARVLNLTPAGVAFLSQQPHLSLRRHRRGKYILYNAADIPRLSIQRAGRLPRNTPRDPRQLLQLVGA
jgi:hypothetical protein